MDTLVRADELKDYSTIRLYTPLGGTYEAKVDSAVIIKGRNVVITTMVGTENEPGPKLVVDAHTMLTVTEIPDLTPYGLLRHFTKIWKAKVEGTEGDIEWVAAAEMLGELEALLPEVLKAHEVCKRLVP